MPKIKKKKVQLPALDLVAKQWGIKELRHVSACHHAVRILETDEGARVAFKQVKSNVWEKDAGQKDIDETVAKINRRLGVVDRMRQIPGVPEIAAPFPFPDNPDQFVLMWEGHGYCLMPFIEGRRPSYRRLADLKPVLRALARFLKAGLENASLRSSLGTPTAKPSLGDIFATELAQYKKTLTRIEEFNRGRLLKKALRSKQDLAEELIALGQAVLQRGGNGDYQVTILHGDTFRSNFLFTQSSGPSNGRDEKCAILDVETVRRGSRAEDLIDPFAIHCAHRGFQRKDVENLLTAYETEYPLSESERDYIYARLILPRHWLRIMHRLLKGSRVWWSPLHLQKLRYALKCLPAQKRLADSVLNS